MIDDLTADGYVYRFRHQPGPLHEAEGAFLLCGFHLALATHQQGDAYSAVRWFERNRGALGPPGLFTEEFDVVQRQLRGNLPQAFVHALLIETAHTLTTDTYLGDPMSKASDHHARRRRDRSVGRHRSGDGPAVRRARRHRRAPGARRRAVSTAPVSDVEALGGRAAAYAVDTADARRRRQDHRRRSRRSSGRSTSG